MKQDCDICDAKQTVTEELVTAVHPYGGMGQTFTATYPVMTCLACDFQWSDYRGEMARDLSCQEAQRRDPARWLSMKIQRDELPNNT